METNSQMEFRDESQYPEEELLKAVLNQSYPAYRKLMDLFAQNELNPEWRYYQDGKAWLCKVQKKKKTIVWMSAWKGYMQAVIYFPERYMEQVYKLDISEMAIEKFKASKNVGKSKPCIFQIRDASILIDFEKVMIFKIGCK